MSSYWPALGKALRNKASIKSSVVGVIALLLLLILATPALAAPGDPTVFARLSLPLGVTTDRGGNVFVHSDAVTTTVVTKFSPNGAPLGQVPIGGVTVGEIGHMATDPGTGLIWHLSQNGNIRQIDPNTGQVALLGNVRQTPVDTSRIYDVATGQVGSMAGLILPQQATYGDIALLRRSNQLDVFITGTSTAFPFVVRLRFIANQFQSARVVISSRATASPDNNQPRGVAVNNRGTVLTTLPLGPNRFPIGNFDRVVGFSPDLPENRQQPRLGLGGRNLTSRGMTADSAGNFYVATGVIGTSLCGAGGSGALVRLTSDLSRFSCRNLGVVLADSRDVALSPNGATAYMTIQNLNLVASMAPPPAPPPPPPAPPPTPQPNTAAQISGLRPAPNSVTRDRTPSIRAVVRDRETNLRKGNIKLYLDGKRIKKFSYKVRTDRLSYTSKRLKYGRHKVKVTAKDARGKVTTRVWRFKVVKKRR